MPHSLQTCERRLASRMSERGTIKWHLARRVKEVMQFLIEKRTQWTGSAGTVQGQRHRRLWRESPRRAKGRILNKTASGPRGNVGTRSVLQGAPWPERGLQRLPQPPVRLLAKCALIPIVVPASACETGQPRLASSHNSRNFMSLIPGTTASVSR